MRATITMALAAAALQAAGCSNRDPYVTQAGAVSSGNWTIERQPDRVTGAPMSSALLVGPSSNTYVDIAKGAMLQLTCFDRQPLVRFAFDFKVGSDSNSFLGYRFDDKPGRDNIAGVRFLQEYRTVVIEQKADVAQFVADLAGASVLYVRIRSLNAGRTTAEFKLEGAAAAVQAAFADCPLNPDPARKRTS